MKKLFVSVPAILLAGLFLLNSFVLTEKKGKNKPVKEGKSPVVADIIYRSADGGQTWQDISEGLPAKLQMAGVWSGGIVADEHGLYLRAGKEVYHSNSNSAISFWTKKTFPGAQRSIVRGRTGIFAYDIRGRFLQKINGSDNWTPIYPDFQQQAVRLDTTKDWTYRNYKEREVRTVFETTGGTVFIGSNNSLFRSANSGKTWSRVRVGEGRARLAELNGILLTTSKDGLYRSTNDGKNWKRVLGEGGLGNAVERIDGGFAAIVYNPTTRRNSLYISQDSGKSWNAVDDKLPFSWSSLLPKKISTPQYSPDIISVRQAGKYLICSRTDGIFRSSDLGETWEKVPDPAGAGYGFNLSVSGNVVYAIPNKGC